MKDRKFDPYEIAKQQVSRFIAPPSMLPAGNVDVSGNGRWRIWEFAGTKIDAPILGNGDMLAAFAGPPRWPQFWLSTNDFWQMESNPNWEFFHENETAKFDPPVSLGSPRPLGRIVFDLPGMEGAGYEAWQEFGCARTCACYTTQDNKVKLSSWVAARENLLVVEFSADKPIDIGVEFLFPNELGKGCDIGVDFEGLCESDVSLSGSFVGLVGSKPLQVKNQRKGILYGYREFSDGVDVPTRTAFAGKFVGEESVTAKITPGKTLVFVAPLRALAKTSRPLEYARSRAGWITKGELADVWSQHERWWKEYWQVSGIQVDDALIEEKYYLSQYMLASLSRDPDYPPNILGISTFDRMAWNGNYKINYNHQSPYLGLLASGHFEQSDPHDSPYLAMLDIGREMSQRLLGHPGVYLPLGLGPVGMVSEALLLHMKSPAVHGALNMLMRYRLTLDEKYLQKVYPYLKSVADFWEHDLVMRDGKYCVTGDGMHERVTKDINPAAPPLNPTNTLGYLRYFFREMAQISLELSLDAGKRDKWLEIASTLAPFKVGVIADIKDNPTIWQENDLAVTETIPNEHWHDPVFYNEETGNRWSFHFPANIMHIYPGGAIGLGSPKEELDAARNTVHALSCMEDELGRLRHRKALESDGENADCRDPHFFKSGAWNATNLSCLFFPAAVRVGYDPDVIWRELTERLRHRGLPNGFVDGNPHGIENLSTVPNTIQEMMLLSHEGILRIFRVWPRETHPDAAFVGLWAYNAFVVGARLQNGEIVDLRIESTKGKPCTVENPWPGKGVLVSWSSGSLITSGDVLAFDTAGGETYMLQPV